MTTHKIKKGLDLPLAGRAEFVLADATEPTEVGLETAEFAPSRFDAIERAYRQHISYVQTNRVDRAVYLRGR